MVFDTNVNRLCWIFPEYKTNCSSWKVFDNKLLQLIGLYMKNICSYIWCKHAISAQDGWHLEIESCNLLPIWKMTGKSTYFRLQCEFMELFYEETKTEPIFCEIMRANNFCVQYSGKAVAYDDENEYYNMLLKKTPGMPLIDIAITRSHNVMIAHKAAREMWGNPIICKNARGASLEHNIIKIECVISSCMTNEDCEGMLENGLKNLGNMSCKLLHRYATTNLFVHGKRVLRKNLHKTSPTSIAKLQHKRDMILDSIKYHSVQMAHQREQLVQCSTQSANVNTVHTIPSWKQSYKQSIRLN
jgi:hypothetical protein